MKLYCTNNQLDSKKKVRLTIGKWYEMISLDHCAVILRNDSGRRASYDISKYFATKQELRDILLDKLLEN
jgi:hypothetical protein